MEPHGPRDDGASELPPAPFEPGAARNPAGSGCAKFALVGCLGLLIALGIGLLVMVTQAPKLFGWMLDHALAQIESRYAPDVGDADKARVRAAFAAAAEAVDEKRIDPLAMQKVQTRLMDALGGQRKIERERALALAQALEELAASRPPETPPG
ncbi:MAG TPA: hypothetical protein VF121_15680 [Thermoanaerobaculia bacterium]|nr:hypothetical protein [Thermoanaerobaculia bacterium]